MTQTCSHSQCLNEHSCIYISTYASPTSPFARAKRQAQELRRGMSVFTSIKGVTDCTNKFLLARDTIGGREVIEVTKRCNNKHACPCCMPYLYSQLAKRFEPLLDCWVLTGGSIYTQTLTLPNRPKSLIFKHDDIAKTWQKMGKSKGFGKLRTQYGVTQYLRVTEDVLRVKKSFPHFHLTWFFNRQLTHFDMEAFCSAIAELWSVSAVKEGIRGTQAARQWCGPILVSNKSYSRYIFKHGYFNINFDPLAEMNLGRGLKPLDFLRAIDATGDLALIEVWLEYEHATSGRHRVQPSRNFLWSRASSANE